MPITGKQIKDGTIPSSKLLGGITSQAPIVIDKDLVTSPGPGSTGDKYIIAGIGGSWSGGTINDIAEDLDGLGTDWDFVTPVDGFEAWVLDEDAAYRFDGSDWLYQLGVTAAGTTIETPILNIDGNGILLVNGGAIANADNVNAGSMAIDASLGAGGNSGALFLSDQSAVLDEKLYSLKN